MERREALHNDCTDSWSLFQVRKGRITKSKKREWEMLEGDVRNMRWGQVTISSLVVSFWLHQRIRCAVFFSRRKKEAPKVQLHHMHNVVEIVWTFSEVSVYECSSGWCVSVSWLSHQRLAGYDGDDDGVVKEELGDNESVILTDPGTWLSSVSSESGCTETLVWSSQVHAFWVDATQVKILHFETLVDVTTVSGGI